jgi:hypothetical protein
MDGWGADVVEVVEVGGGVQSGCGAALWAWMAQKMVGGIEATGQLP